MNYTDTVEYLYACLPIYQKIGSAALKKDLTNTRILLQVLGNPHDSFKTIHIAGTNGKGSTAHTLAAILQAAGYKTGLYTSPHLKSFTERIKINGKEMTESAVVDFVRKMKDKIEAIKPSFFEVTVAMALDFFAREEVDIAVVETGLGGRLDSTNIILPQLAVITNIGFDHQAILGNTLEEIASEKAGIIKPDIPVVIGEYQPSIAHVFEDKAGKVRAPIYFADKSYEVKAVDSGNDGFRVDIYFLEEIWMQDLHVSLPGMYQLKNVPGILQAVQVLRQMGYQLTDTAVKRGFSQVKSLTGLKGRWQILQESPLVVCDTGHNEAGIGYIVKHLSALNHKELYIIFGVANDKTLDPILAALPKEAFYFFCQAHVPRALGAVELASQASRFGLKGKVVLDVNDALEEAKAMANNDDVIFIGGSNFVVAEIDGL